MGHHPHLPQWEIPLHHPRHRPHLQYKSCNPEHPDQLIDCRIPPDIQQWVSWSARLTPV